MIEFFFFFFKQKTAYEMRISDWSSDVCSSDLADPDLMATHLRCLCEADIIRNLLGAREPYSDENVRAKAQCIVDVFLKVYGKATCGLWAPNVYRHFGVTRLSGATTQRNPHTTTAPQSNRPTRLKAPPPQ